MLVEKGEPLPIFGDGSTGRDCTYVDDIVAGVLAAMRLELTSADGHAPFEVFNLGNSHPVKLSELVDLLEAATGRRVIRQRQPPQPGDVPLTWADVSKAARMLGYRPSTHIKEGLQRFVAWYRAAAVFRADRGFRTFRRARAKVRADSSVYRERENVNVAVIGAGRVGLVAAAGLADDSLDARESSGHDRRL